MINRSVAFLPIMFVMQPHRKLPTNPPTHNKPAIHDAWPIFIFPDGKGDSSDKSRIKLGDDQPHAKPWFRESILTVQFRNKLINSLN